jgi:hypothetical protein
LGKLNQALKINKKTEHCVRNKNKVETNPYSHGIPVVFKEERADG